MSNEVSMNVVGFYLRDGVEEDLPNEEEEHSLIRLGALWEIFGIASKT